MVPDVRKAFEEALQKKVLVSTGDKKVLMSRIKIGLEQLLNQFAKGDRHARSDLIKYAEMLGIDFLAKHRQTIEDGVTPNYQAILDSFFARRSAAGNVAPAKRVFAPAELLDDDRAEDEPAESKPKLPSPPARMPGPIGYKVV